MFFPKSRVQIGLPAPGPCPRPPPVCKTAFSAPGTGLRTFCRQTASSGRDSIRCAHSGPSQRLLRPRYAGTCIRRAPPPARVRGWTRPPAAASCRLPPFPCAKRSSLPPGHACRGFPCANRAFLPPGRASCGSPCANRAFLPPGILATLRNNRHICFN